MEEAAEERRHAVAVVRLDGALVAAVVAGNARDGLGRLDVREARLVVKRGGNRHLARAALLLLPSGQRVVGFCGHRVLFDSDGLLPQTEETAARHLLLLLAGHDAPEVRRAR